MIRTHSPRPPAARMVALAVLFAAAATTAAADIEKRRLGPNVNTPYAELLPIASADGNTLYLTRAGYPDPGFRRLIEQQYDEHVSDCRQLGPAMATLAEREGHTFSPEEQALIDRLSGDCDRMARIRDEELARFDRGQHPQQVYVTQRRPDGSWGPTRRLPAPLNDPTPSNLGNVAISSAAPDRNTLLVIGALMFGEQRTDGCVDFAAVIGMGDRHCLSIAIARRDGESWTRSDRLRTEPFDPPLSVNGAALAPDGRTVVFTGRTPGRHIDNHSSLYLTRWNEDTGLWSAPRRLDALNGPFENVSPFIGPDGVSLYFASSRPGGQGGLDIWVSRRSDERWLDWSAPVNLGPSINTPQNDSSLSVDASGGFAFMASGEGAQQDIYEFGLPPDLRPAPTAVVGGQVLRGGALLFNDENAGGEIVDFELGRGRFAGAGDGAADGMDEQTVVFMRLADGRVAGSAGIDPASGAYSTSLPVNASYAVYVNARGFAGIGEVVDLSGTRPGARIEQDLTVQPLAPGEVIRLNNVFFETDSAELLEESRAELDRLVLLLERHPTLRIEIAGHTDSRSSDDYNLRLSDDRAGAVRGYLEDADIEPARLQSRGYGEGLPIADNDTEEGRALNRRVEFRILAH
ncbi:OmpA family protein [Wenzhouxiangella sp. XN79A]|uniref:OmpA family protein n=1 Tax=Wenzhouxiangella sp. XN79A TaxID=2724193 RepID=UPI00144AB12A|nr:OmpA family protein [Wenzhouxiangella sp. XN79A]NKI34018.1 OmpA family protein [Wenzhouxiangella sp. XN79A]